MQSTRFANVFSLPLLTAAFAGVGVAQAQIQAPAEPDAATPAADPKLKGLPTFLLPVPGGKVDIGLTAEQLIDASCQTAFPSRPEVAPKTSTAAVETSMRRSVSVLGRVSVDVAPFLLAKWPVKNSEYAVFVERSRLPNSGVKPVRPPFHWWRFGCEKDYEARLAEINQRFPGNSKGPVLYWHQEGPTLPFKLQDENGNSIADHAVGNVSYIDANEFAASLGMRLPLESEWMRAARGDRSNNWPWGDPQDPDKDKFTGPASLKWLKLYNARDRAPKPVGSVANASGPFGHVDMFGSVWQFVTGPGWHPVNGVDEFSQQWKALQKDKTGALIKAPPMWRNDRIIAKGGSYLSGEDPIQLLIDQRAPMFTDDILESAGFRLAKSLRPGYDTLFSRLRGIFNRSQFEPDQEINLEAQIGAERYVLGDNGFPTSYHTVSFAPTTWLSRNKKDNLRTLFESSHKKPLVVGALITTEAIVGTETTESLFTVLYRAPGMPKDLESAIKRGYKQVQAELKAAERAAKSGKPVKEDAGKDKKDKKDKNDWVVVLRRHGLTREDLEAKGSDKLRFVRIDGTKVSTERGAYLLSGNEGKVLSAIEAPNAQPKAGKPFATELTLVAGDDGKATTKFRLGVPLTMQRADRVAELHFHLQLGCPAPTAEKPWRLPE